MCEQEIQYTSSETNDSIYITSELPDPNDIFLVKIRKLTNQSQSETTAPSWMIIAHPERKFLFAIDSRFFAQIINEQVLYTEKHSSNNICLFCETEPEKIDSDSRSYYPIPESEPFHTHCSKTIRNLVINLVKNHPQYFISTEIKS